MKNPDRGIRVFAVNNTKVQSKFDIYLEFSGKREWLMIHRHNGFLYGMLKDGVSLAELRRATGRTRNQLKYLLQVIDEYLEEMRVA